MRIDDAVQIHSLDDKGRGVAKIDGKATFVVGALPNEVVYVDLVEDKKRFSTAECAQIVKVSPERVEPPCPVFAQCGGCQLQHLNIDAQRDYKQMQWLEQLARIGQAEPQEALAPVVGEPWHYRHRAKLSVTYADRAIILGFKAAKSHQIVDIESCVILTQRLSNLLPSVKKALTMLLPFKVYEVEMHEGESAIAIGLSMQDKIENKADYTALENAFASYLANKSLGKPIQLWIKQNKGGYKALLPQEAKLHYDLPCNGLSVDYTPNDFTQINHAMNRQMVQMAIELLAPAVGDRIADLFCGLGNFSFPLAATGAKVISVEGVVAMVKRLQEQATKLGLASNIQAIKQDLFAIQATDIKKWGHVDKWLLDPPRAGAKELIEALPKGMRPSKIVYVSCNPATLARDAKLLLDKGYRLTSGRMIDFFPQTAHIESINVFERII